MSESPRHPVTKVDRSKDLDVAERLWLEGRLIEYRDVLDYLRDH